MSSRGILRDSASSGAVSSSSKIAPNNGMIQSPMTTCARAISVSEGLARLGAVSNALTDLRLAGLASDAQVCDLLNHYVSSDISDAELLSAILSG